MKYKFRYRTSATDLWQLSMYYIYGSMTGVVNTIFTIALIALTYSKWNSTNLIFRIIMILGCLLFSVIQPCIVYYRSSKQANRITDDTQMSFDDRGIYIKVGREDTKIEWKNIKRVSKKPTMIIIFSDRAYGYVLNNKTLGKNKKEFYDYIVSKIG